MNFITWLMQEGIGGKEDLDHLAELAVQKIPLAFGTVVAASEYGETFAAALRKYSTHGPRLIADFLLSPENPKILTYASDSTTGVVVYSYGIKIPAWITSVIPLPGPSLKDILKDRVTITHTTH
ncbi:MAG: hypothetical protein AAB691_03720 [Patescibacteria group bacterium]